MQNKRRLFRVGIKGVEKATMINFENIKSTYPIILVNVSGNGVSFNSKKKFPISRFNKFLFIFKLEGEKFNLKGYIVRRKPIENDYYTNYGVKFDSLSVQEETALISVLNRYQTKHYRFDHLSE